MPTASPFNAFSWVSARRGTRRRPVTVLAVVLAVAVVAGPATITGTGMASAQAAPALSGMVTDVTWYVSRADMDRSVAMMREAGVKWARANVNWSSVEPGGKGMLDAWWLAELDYAVSSLQTAGIQVLMPIADGVPYWASGDPRKYTDATGRHWNQYWKPANFADYADFARAIVSRYASRGVHHYEVWNEPNYARFWPSGPSPADYTAMLRAAAPAIRQADPSAKIVLGGLSLSDYPFLQGLYSAGAAPLFDIVAVHPYTGSVDPNVCWYASGTTRYAKESFCAIAEVRNTMLANGDSRPIWLTEFGWATAPVPGGVSEATQSAYLTAAFTKLATYPYVTNAFWYSFRNNYWQGNDQGDLEANYGLVRVDYTTKPAYGAFRAHAGTGPAPTTTTTGPTTTRPPATTTTTAPPVLPTTTVALDTTSPLLSRMKVSNIERTAAVAKWSTNEPAAAAVEWWPVGSTVVSRTPVAGLRTSHAVTLSGLAARTTYAFRAVATDSSGNTSVSATSSFTTRP